MRIGNSDLLAQELQDVFNLGGLEIASSAGGLTIKDAENVIHTIPVSPWLYPIHLPDFSVNSNSDLRWLITLILQKLQVPYSTSRDQILLYNRPIAINEFTA